MGIQRAGRVASRRDDERCETWRFCGVELRHVSRSSRCWRVVNEGLCIGLTLAGATSYVYRGRAFTKERGVVTIHEPGETYRATAQNGRGEAVVVTIPPTIVKAWIGDVTGAGHFVPTPSRDDVVARAIRELHRRALHGADPREVVECAREILCALVRSRTEKRSPEPVTATARENRAIVTAREMLAAELSRTISLEELACAVGLNKLYLSTMFRQTMGAPPHAYHLRLRLAHARSALSIKSTIVDVAAQFGFADQSHFTRCFRDAYGVSPGRFVRSLREP